MPIMHPFEYMGVRFRTSEYLPPATIVLTPSEEQVKRYGLRPELFAFIVNVRTPALTDDLLEANNGGVTDPPAKQGNSGPG